MSERVVEAEVVGERIVACPQCRRRNRLYKRASSGVYRCGACRATLANPFAAHAMRMPSMRIAGIVGASLVAILVLLIIIGSNSSAPRTPAQQEEIRRAAERDARVDKVISDSGASALPPIPKPSYYTSSPVPIPSFAPLPSISVAQFTPFPRYSRQPAAPPPPEAPTEVPRNGILIDAYPGSTALGEFTVINGSSRHAIAKVIDIGTDSKILSFAIHAGKRTKITAIPDGTYNVIFAFGDRVYLGTDRFEKPRGFSKFDRPFTFTTTATTTATDTEDATYYRTRTSATTLEVTLTPVIGGNITTSGISQQEFERY